jgi:hypothetical protein
MKRILVGLITLGLASQAYAQEIQTEELSEVVVSPVNYKYLNETDNMEAAIPVQMLQRKVASYDVEESGFYQDDWGLYTVSFFIPDGKIVAVYDKNGKVVRTIEHFKDVALPPAVRNAIVQRFPNWTLAEDSYRVTYGDKKAPKKSYKVTIKNGEKTMKVKVTDEGEFL